MRKISRSIQSRELKAKPAITIGLDLGDRWSHYCMLNEAGEVIEEGRIATTEAGIRRQFEGEPAARVAMECGTHSPWISRQLKQLGHQVIVANARKLRAISQNESKNDRADAEMLARLAASDPRLLAPIHHRSRERQQDLNLIRARDVLVRARTMLINAVRGLAKSAGTRLPACDAAYFAQHTAHERSRFLALAILIVVTFFLVSTFFVTEEILETICSAMGERPPEPLAASLISLPISVPLTALPLGRLLTTPFTDEITCCSGFACPLFCWPEGPEAEQRAAHRCFTASRRPRWS